MANTNFLSSSTDLDSIFVPRSAVYQPGERKPLWSWGRNSYGQLGLGDVTNRSSPVHVGSLTTWSGVSGGAFHSLALQNY